MLFDGRPDSMENDDGRVRRALHKAHATDPWRQVDRREAFTEDGEGGLASSGDARIEVDGCKLKNRHFCGGGFSRNSEEVIVYKGGKDDSTLLFL